ncbi:unnamed protein product, partial [Heterosigma akashiwo]
RGQRKNWYTRSVTRRKCWTMFTMRISSCAALSSTRNWGTSSKLTGINTAARLSTGLLSLAVTSARRRTRRGGDALVHGSTVRERGHHLHAGGR